MKIAPKKVLFLVIVIFVTLVIGFIALLVYENREDISDQKPYTTFLNKPLKVNKASTIRWNKNNLRFSHYSLVVNEDSHLDSEGVKSLKWNKPGDIITFHAAKSYYSIHVDKTYYLIARDTLSTGEIIEFEYYYTPNETPFN